MKTIDRICGSVSMKYIGTPLMICVAALLPGNHAMAADLEGSKVSAATSMAKANIDVPAGSYTLDKAHASLLFRVSHMSFSHYTAQFRQFDAKLQFDPIHPEASQVDANVDPRSLALPSPPAGFTEELLGKNWLDAGQYPQIIFHSTKVELTGPTSARITGDLTLHGATNPLVLEATFNGGYKGLPGMDPHARIGFSAHGVLKRSDYGVAFGIPQPGSNMGVSDEVEIVLESEFNGPALTEASTQSDGKR